MSKIRFADYLKEYLEFNNITNKDFANRIGISQKHLIDILSGKRELSSNIINNISLVTNIPCDYIYRVELNYKLEEEIEEYLKQNNFTINKYLNKFNYKFLIQNKWIDFTDTGDKIEIIKDILKYLRVTNPSKVYEIDEKIFYKSNNDKPELLLLWLEKCYRIARNQKVESYKKENIEILVKYIQNRASENVFNKDDLIKKFNDNGIALVIEEDIPGSKIRGAFRVNKNMPSVYITYKHKRIADIYFALLHELAHCKSNFNEAKATSLISYDNELDSEEKADIQAYDWMVDKDYYDVIKRDKDYSVVKEDKFPMCFIVYLLARDNIIKYSSVIYQKYNILLENK